MKCDMMKCVQPLVLIISPAEAMERQEELIDLSTKYQGLFVLHGTGLDMSDLKRAGAVSLTIIHASNLVAHCHLCSLVHL